MQDFKMHLCWYMYFQSSLPQSYKYLNGAIKWYTQENLGKNFTKNKINQSLNENYNQNIFCCNIWLLPCTQKLTWIRTCLVTWRPSLGLELVDFRWWSYCWPCSRSRMRSAGRGESEVGLYWSTNNNTSHQKTVRRDSMVSDELCQVAIYMLIKLYNQ